MKDKYGRNMIDKYGRNMKDNNDEDNGVFQRDCKARPNISFIRIMGVLTASHISRLRL